ncbi:NADH dehydrogenase [ubiquinone] 1 beta subcomplex subunit 9 [Acorus gramineus]|uniref:NADH dehydrogenase [ubiquinone] 1 beta subcomplex subunit 9 n=1 Tax=Acorus gramineus TaxID=55184 RepID=A0AAV9AAY5_ACOGR|nr:NADH dehydrogenase [ubiquinone] 1 beta subcomplex subunit 9 [Acorus gramineus]
MGSTIANYLLRRASQKERVRILYRRALKDTLNWSVHRHMFYSEADKLRQRFEANKNVEDLDTIDRLIEEAEVTYNKYQHPDPYIVPWAPGGSKFTRNPPPPPGIEIVFDYGTEEHI